MPLVKEWETQIFGEQLVEVLTYSTPTPEIKSLHMSDVAALISNTQSGDSTPGHDVDLIDSTGNISLIGHSTHN